MTSEQAYIWITLPGATAPTLAGRLTVDENGGTFVYGRSYLRLGAAVPFDPVELHLTDAVHHVAPDRNSGLPGAIRDACPDYWGRYVLGAFRGEGMSEVSLLLRSPDDRVGALSFSPSTAALPAPGRPTPTVEGLEELGAAILRHEREHGPWGDSDAAPASPRALALVGGAGTSLGGARPKLTVLDEGALWLAKGSRSDDAFDYPRTEAAMLDLARLAGIETPDASVRRLGHRDALLVRRFDRHALPDGGLSRTRFCSALSALRADDRDEAARSYLALADEVRRVCSPAAGPELFTRMTFNALINNGDDHLRNHGIIATGRGWSLSPAYDLVPQPTVSHDVRLALRVGDAGRTVTLSRLIACSARFGLSRDEATVLVARLVEVVRANWEACLRGRGVRPAEIEHLSGAFLKPGLQAV